MKNKPGKTKVSKNISAKMLIIIVTLVAIISVILLNGIEGSKNVIGDKKTENLKNEANSLNFAYNDDFNNNSDDFTNRTNNNEQYNNDPNYYYNEQNNYNLNNDEQYNLRNSTETNKQNGDVFANTEIRNNQETINQNLEDITPILQNNSQQEIASVQINQYEEGIKGSYLSWNLNNIDTNNFKSFKNTISNFENCKDSLKVEKYAKTKTGLNFATPGDEITYTITVENVTKKNEYNLIEVKDKVPQNTTFVSCENGLEVKNEEGQVIGVRWNVNLNKENNYFSNVSFTVKVNDDAQGTIKNSEAFADGTKIKDEAKTSIIKANKIATVKNKKQTEPAVIGDIICYQIMIKNTGEVEGSTFIKDEQLSNLIYDDILSLDDENGNGLNGKETANELLDGKTISLKQYETKTFEFEARVNKVSNSINNFAILKLSQNAENPESEENFPQNTLNSAGFTFESAVLNKQNEPFELGEQINYKLTIKNLGSSNLKNVKITAKINEENQDLGNIAQINIIEKGKSKDIYFSYIVKENDLGQDGKYGKIENNFKVFANIENSLQTLEKSVSGESLTNFKIIEEEPEVICNYNVKFYYENVEEKSLQFEAKQNTEIFKEDINSLIYENTKTGYKFKLSSVDQNPLKISNQEDLNIIKIYYEKDESQKKDLMYTVNYYKDNLLVEKDTYIVKEKVWINSSQTTLTVKEIDKSNEKYDGYQFEKTYPQTIPEKIENGSQINVYYTRKDTSVLVHYYKQGTNEKVSDDVLITGKVQDSYKTKASSNVISKYELVEVPDNFKGEMTSSQIVVVYYYKLKDAKVTVHHYISGTTEKLADDEIILGKMDDEYKTNKLTNLQNGFLLQKEPINANGIMNSQNTEVIYYYAKPLEISKVIYKHGTNLEISKANVGQTITYNIEISNENNVPIKTTVTDILPEGITVLENTISNNGNYQNNKIVWENILIESGGKTLTYNAKINDNIIGTSNLINNVGLVNIDGNEIFASSKIDINEIKINKVQAQVTNNQTKDVNIMLIMDLSNSMNGTTSDQGVTRLDAAKTAVQTFIKNVYEDENSKIKDIANIKIITFNAKDPIYNWREKVKYSGTQVFGTANKDNYTNLNNEISQISYYNTGFITHMGAALTLAKNNLDANKQNIIVFLSDGAPYYKYTSGGRTYVIEDNTPDVIKALAEEIKQNNTDIYSIGFGTEAGDENSEAYGLLSDMSSNGRVETSNSVTELSANFNNIFGKINETSFSKTENGVITINANNVILNDESHPISVIYTDSEDVEHTLFNVVNSNSEYGLMYDGEKITFDINVWNNLQSKIHITNDTFTLKFYVQ